MTPAKTCSSCAWCTDKNLMDQTGICAEPHAPRNAKGQITSRTHLSTAACRKYQPAEEEPVAETPRKHAGKKKPVRSEDQTP